MKRPTRRQLILGAIVLAVAAAVVVAFLPEPLPVDVAPVTTGPLQVLVEVEGETSITDRFIVTAPVVAYARRITLEEGDIVKAGEPLVQLEPPRAAILDPRVQAQANAAVRAAAAAVDEAAVVVERTIADRRRMETLYEAGAITQQEAEEARAAAVRAQAALDAARANYAAAQAAARATSGGGSAVPATLHAPVGGRVLAVHRTSEGHVNPGEPLIEIGDTRGIEVRADVLSADAVRIDAGTRVLIDEWGGEQVLEGVVTRVEPEGLTEVSALGVEEQRVPVRATITTPPEQWAGLGSGYRVLARFVLWERPAVLQVPAAALFRTGEEWSTFVVEDGRARLRAVRIGEQAGLRTQVLDGLVEGETVVVHPPNELADGGRVEIRS